MTSLLAAMRNPSTVMIAHKLIVARAAILPHAATSLLSTAMIVLVPIAVNAVTLHRVAMPNQILTVQNAPLIPVISRAATSAISHAVISAAQSVMAAASPAVSTAPSAPAADPSGPKKKPKQIQSPRDDRGLFLLRLSPHHLPHAEVLCKAKSRSMRNGLAAHASRPASAGTSG